MNGLKFGRGPFFLSAFVGAGSAMVGAISGGVTAAIGSVVSNLVNSDNHPLPDLIKTGAMGTAAVVGSTAALYTFLSASGLKDKAMDAYRSLNRHEMIRDLTPPTRQEARLFLIKLGLGISTTFSIVQLLGGLVGYGLRQEEIWPISMEQVEMDMAIGSVISSAVFLGGAAFLINKLGVLDEKHFPNDNNAPKLK